jgi:anti-sigma B factor antagonist
MSIFSTQLKETDGKSIIELSGDLDAHTTSQLEKVFEELLAKGKYRIVVNFKNLNYISSAGLGVFMAFIDDVRQNNGDIKLAGMPDKIFNVFDLLGFPLLYEIYKEETEALEKFNAK